MTIINLCFKKTLLLMTLAISFSSLCKASGEHYDNEPMKFKLGFEFQETSGLCKGALNDQEVQKKALFRTLDNGNRKLWKVVIDTNDIEFVTEPFTYQERSRLKGCLESLIGSFQKLEHLLEETPQITFTDWINSLKAPLSAQHYRLKLTKHFRLVENKMIEQPLGWKPRFTPQVTIQHPLEYAIPIYFSLFGFDNRQYTLPFSAALPFMDQFVESIRKAESENYERWLRVYSTKYSGLIFLHALTLVQMTPPDKEKDEDDSDHDKMLLEQNLFSFKNSYQLDAKMKLSLMSRRPFSEMFKDAVPEARNKHVGYADFFKKALGANWSFKGFFRVPTELSKTNYGEQFFVGTPAVARSLESFKNFIEPTFLEDNKDAITYLLNNGVITTTILRHFKKDILTSDGKNVQDLFRDYYDQLLESIEYPENKYIISFNNEQIQLVDSEYDMLSPPWFLDGENSMGRFKETLSEDDKEYGEAIIEVRAINSVGERFLRRLNLLENGEEYVMGEFLKYPSARLPLEALSLFDYLVHFKNPRNTMDIQVGLTYAVLKH